jgi:hypothetical protein
MHRVIRRSLIVAAATLMPCFVSPLQAAPAAQNSSGAQTSSARPLKLTHATKRKAHRVRKSSRHRRVERRTRTTTKTAKVEESKKLDVVKQEAPPEPLTLETSRLEPSGLEPSIANAHAELTAGDPQAQTPTAIPMESDKTVSDNATASSVHIAAGDQLNNIDQSAANTATATPSPSVSMASYSESSAAFSQAASEGDAWDRASLIGKIFIAFGTLLTLASAARLMIA